MSDSPGEPGSELEVPWGDIFSQGYSPTAVWKSEILGEGTEGSVSVCVCWGGHGDGGGLFICT